MNRDSELAINRARQLGARGDLAAAEAALREVIDQGNTAAEPCFELAHVLAAQAKDPALVMQALRDALERDRNFAPAVHALGLGLLELGQAADALELARPLAEGTQPDAGALSVKGQAMVALGQVDAGLEILRRAATYDRSDPLHQYVLANALLEAGLNGEATRAARAARVGGDDRPETWLVEGLSLLEQDRLGEAEMAFQSALRRRPDYAEAHRALSRTVWAKSGDVAAALVEIEKAIAAKPASQELRVARAEAFTDSGDERAAYDSLRNDTGAFDDGVAIQLAAAEAALSFDALSALDHARRAARAAPEDVAVLSVLAAASLAAGDTEEGAKAAGRLRALQPDSPNALALENTAWRMLSDPRYSERADYGSLVRSFLIDPPDGWNDLPAYLSALTAGLDRLHGAKSGWGDRTLRGGTRTGGRLQRSANPAIRSIMDAIYEPICQMIDDLGQGPDPVRSRNTGRYSLSSISSVSLQPGGRQVHAPPGAGWLSAVFFAEVPAVVEGEGREGWLHLGRPDFPTVPALEAEHWVKPEPGRLVIFPSYMWRGIAPFSGEHRLLTMAFDLLPS